MSRIQREKECIPLFKGTWSVLGTLAMLTRVGLELESIADAGELKEGKRARRLQYCSAVKPNLVVESAWDCNSSTVDGS